MKKSPAVVQGFVASRPGQNLDVFVAYLASGLADVHQWIFRRFRLIETFFLHDDACDRFVPLEFKRTPETDDPLVVDAYLMRRIVRTLLPCFRQRCSARLRSGSFPRYRSMRLGLSYPPRRFAEKRQYGSEQRAYRHPTLLQLLVTGDI